MKTRNLLGFLPFLLMSMMSAGDSIKLRGSNYSVGGYNPIFIPRHGKFKGYMRENRKCTFNKNR